MQYQAWQLSWYPILGERGKHKQVALISSISLGYCAILCKCLCCGGHTDLILQGSKEIRLCISKQMKDRRGNCGEVSNAVLSINENERDKTKGTLRDGMLM